MNVKELKIGFLAFLVLVGHPLVAGRYWNGTRYIEDEEESFDARKANDSRRKIDLDIDPSAYESKTQFLEEYLDQELARLSAEQRDDDRKTLGGVKARKLRIARAGERIWKAAHPEPVRVERETDENTQYFRGKPLISLFGIELGAVPELWKYERIRNSNTYVFKPSKQFRKYRRYVFSVTPITHQVYGIRASDFDAESMENSDRAMERECEAVRNALELKFNKKAKVDDDAEHDGRFKLLFPDVRGRNVSREIVVDVQTSVMAIDLRLKQLAAKEKNDLAEQAARKVSAVDAEAL